LLGAEHSTEVGWEVGEKHTKRVGEGLKYGERYCIISIVLN
jgi:hypothetical protein